MLFKLSQQGGTLISQRSAIYEIKMFNGPNNVEESSNTPPPRQLFKLVG
jgi:hypothetical protein